MGESAHGDVVRVAYQGEPGAFGEEAIRAHFAERAAAVPCARFEDVGRLLLEGGVDLAFLPVENSIIGPIDEAALVIERYALRTIDEHVLRVRHCLLGLAGARVEGIRAVRSHPAAIAQCAGFLRAHAWMRALPVLDTAGAARQLARDRTPANAAIASRAAATLYGLRVLAADIQDAPDNRTRFAILER
jgi:prephenate dehydratase